MTTTNRKELARRMRVLEGIIQMQQERTDGCDLYTVLSIIADLTDDFDEFIGSRAYWEIINATQSNPAASNNAMIRAHRADNAIARYDEMIVDGD